MKTYSHLFFYATIVYKGLAFIEFPEPGFWSKILVFLLLTYCKIKIKKREREGVCVYFALETESSFSSYPIQ